MDKTAKKLYALIEYCDGISYSGLCAATTIDSGRIGALLRYMVQDEIIYRSGPVGQYRYHISKELADKAVVKPKEPIAIPIKKDIVASCKSKSLVYRFDKLLQRVKSGSDKT